MHARGAQTIPNPHVDVPVFTGEHGLNISGQPIHDDVTLGVSGQVQTNTIWPIFHLWHAREGKTGWDKKIILPIRRVSHYVQRRFLDTTTAFRLKVTLS